MTRELKKQGFPIYLATTPRMDTLENQATTLEKLIEENVEPGKAIILLGHSQGGLVSRLYAHNNSYSYDPRDIVAVTTVGTPHRGSPLSASGRLTNLISDVTFIAVGLQMSEERMAAFNKKITDIPGIHYASVATYTDHLQPWLPGLRTLHFRLNRSGAGPNDGLVPISSAIWGESILDENGEHFKADHISQVMNIPNGFIWNLPASKIGKATARHLLQLSLDRGYIPCDELLIANQQRLAPHQHL